VQSKDSKDEESVDISPRAKESKKKRLAREKGQLCAYRAKELLGIDKAGQLVKCANDKCTRWHPGRVKDISHAAVLEISKSWTTSEKTVKDSRIDEYKKH